MGMLYLHNDIFLTDISGYDRLKFSKIYTLQNDILATPMTFSIISTVVTPNMYCWSSKTLVSILWTHLRDNGICTSFAQRKQIKNIVPGGMLQGQRRHI